MMTKYNPEMLSNTQYFATCIVELYYVLQAKCQTPEVSLFYLYSCKYFPILLTMIMNGRYSYRIP